jgi:hypothetical protein
MKKKLTLNIRDKELTETVKREIVAAQNGRRGNGQRGDKLVRSMAKNSPKN